jgi:hypothetical protein
MLQLTLAGAAAAAAAARYEQAAAGQKLVLGLLDWLCAVSATHN